MNSIRYISSHGTPFALFAAMSSFFRTLALVGMSCLLASCKVTETQNGQGPAGNAEGYAGRKFYWIDPDYECTGADGVKVPSYRGVIEVSLENNIIMRGDSCSNVEKVLTREDIEVAADKRILGYQDGIFERRLTPPVPNDKEEPHLVGFCVGVNNGPLDFIVRARGTPAAYEAIIFHRENGGKVRNKKLPITTSYSNGTRTMESTDPDVRLTAEIDVTKLIVRPKAIGYVGTMSYIRKSGVTDTENIFCRLLPGQAHD